MMSRKTQQGMLLLGVLSLLTFWASRNHEQGTGRQISDLDTRLDYALQDFSVKYFDTRGRPAVTLLAPRLSNNATTGIGTVDHPRLEVQHAGFTWNITADQATVTDTQEKVFLDGHVHIQRSNRRQKKQLEINTRDAVLYIEPRIASSDRHVDLKDAGSHLSATGFSVNMTTDEYQLDSKVKGTYGIP